MSNPKKEKEPEFLMSPMNTPMLNYNVYYMGKAEKMMYTIGLFIIGGLASQVFYGGLFKVDGEATQLTTISNLFFFIVIGIAAVRVFLPAISNLLMGKRAKKLEKQFTNMLESLSNSLSSGSTMYSAIISCYSDMKNQYTDKEPIIQELAEIVAGVENGKTIEEMLMNFGVRSGNDDIKNFSNVINNCYRLGGNFSDVVRKTRDIISDKVAIQDEIETKIASNRLQHNAMSIMPVALVALLKMTSAQFAENLASISGVFTITIALAVFVGAYFWGQKIIDIR